MLAAIETNARREPAAKLGFGEGVARRRRSHDPLRERRIVLIGKGKRLPHEGRIRATISDRKRLHAKEV
jgi:hypothetical protein